MTTAEAAATFDARSFTPPKTKEFDDASTRGRLEHAVRAAVSGRRTGLGVADRRAGAATLRLRLGSVCGRPASRDRRGRRSRRVGARTGRGKCVVRRIRSCGRPRAHDSHRRRLFRDTAAARRDRRAARRRGRGGRARRRGRRELRRGHAPAARAPGRSPHRRRGGLPRPARVPARAAQGRSCGRARSRRGAAPGAGATYAARAARRAARARARGSRSAGTCTGGRSGCADVERGARRGLGRTGRRRRWVGSRSESAADRFRRARRALRSRAGARPGKTPGGPGVCSSAREPGARAAPCDGRPAGEERRDRGACGAQRPRRGSATARARVPRGRSPHSPGPS